jgi:hypothetical protein
MEIKESSDNLQAGVLYTEPLISAGGIGIFPREDGDSWAQHGNRKAPSETLKKLLSPAIRHAFLHLLA